jgi:hypothetical protein
MVLSVMRKPAHKDRRVCIHIPTFDYQMKIIVTGDVTKAAVELGTDKEFAERSAALHIKWPDEGASTLVLGFDAKPGTIAHESWHAVRSMLAWCGAELDNETVGYHLGYLVGQIHDIIKETKAKQICRECGQIGFHKMSCDTRT